MRCYIFDIDGTLTNPAHRLHFIQSKPANWDAFFDACGDDAPQDHICDLAYTLEPEALIILVSGRAERCRDATIAWMARHHIKFTRLYMRADGDHRPDHVVKSQLLGQLIADGYAPIMAFDDRNQVVKMWREHGIPCAQVADGDF